MIIAAFRYLTISALLLAASTTHAAGVPDDCTQLIVATAPDWDSNQGELRLFERTRGEKWTQQGSSIPVLFGKNGLAWGTGLAGQNEQGPRKKERDGRAPAGVFRIGKIYTYDAALPAGANFPFHQVTTADAWVDDPTHPEYNRHVRISDPENPPVWFEKQKMRHNDFAYRWLVEIRHNSGPIVAGDGSAIFFHIRRGETRPTAGCTTMAEADLVRLIKWLKPARRPCYALLPTREYATRLQSWNLPPLAAETALR
ncbi:MAG: L,D-transpeptidase family protein [Verrucomicrobiota bacterium]|nr:L,D-transpeptidase family protein [Chthoniobacterales bacterium]MDQ3626120.1 L,D-transpeptidase family protein [Verrucomicrobiota bacterium]